MPVLVRETKEIVAICVRVALAGNDRALRTECIGI